uniref:Uncharacterized protein n=1 Tax=Avena sativa TaxID=4498 RepID=A0ACD5V8L5_AVESA
MPRLGDPASRPMEGHVVIASTPAMDAEAARLASHAAVIRIGGSRPQTNAAEILEAIHSFTGTERDLIRVVPGYPDDYIATFRHPHHRDKLTALPGRFRHGGLDIHASNWRLIAYADVKDHYHHVHLSIENVPLNAWTDDVATRLLGPATVLHYFDIATLLKEDGSVVSLWAWSSDPNSIPKIQWLTITDNPTAGLGGTSASAVIGRRGLRRRALVHIDLLEDFTPGPDGVIPTKPRTSTPFSFKLGVVDGERQSRDRPRTPPTMRHCSDDDRRRRHDRQDDDDDRDRHGREGRRSSWHQRLFRSRSRAPEHRHHEDRDDRRRDDRGHRDNYDRRGDRRRSMGSGEDARKIDRSRVQLLPGGQVILASGRRRRDPSPEARRRMSRSSSLDVVRERGRSPPASPRAAAGWTMTESSFIGRASWVRLACHALARRSMRWRWRTSPGYSLPLSHFQLPPPRHSCHLRPLFPATGRARRGSSRLRSRLPPLFWSLPLR